MILDILKITANLSSQLNFKWGCAAQNFKMVMLARPIFMKMIPLARLNSHQKSHELGFLGQNLQFFTSLKQNHQSFLFLDINYQNLTCPWPKSTKSIPSPTLTLPRCITLAGLEVRKNAPLQVAHPQVPLLWRNPQPWLNKRVSWDEIHHVN